MAPSGGADLVRRLASDDASAFEEAHRLYAGRCRAVAYRYLRDDAMAQDAVQEAFLSLWRHRAGLVVRAAGVAPWLVVVTRNAALNAARARARRQVREQIDVVPAADPFAPVHARADAVAVRNALAQLPEEQRNVVRMAYFEHHTLASIAEKTGAPLGTVKRRAQLALRRLGQTLGGDPR